MQGRCGIPNHLDMYGFNEINAMEFELSGSGEDTGVVKVNGLGKNYTLLEKWIKENVSKNIQEIHRRGMKKFVSPSFRTPKKVFMPRLTLLDMSNNSIPIPELNLPAITDLYLNGNLMPQLPKNFELWKDSLLYLGIARCGLKSLDNIDRLSRYPWDVGLVP